ncbi:MAG: PspA/IM30 family protein [Candidatus Hatepunaea meridiana]|nr:PspA/IM30 family protein [Candidatus Hatepunaea meridiana]
MAGLLKTFSNLIRGKSQDLAKKMSDPVRDSKLAIQDSEKMIADFTTRIAKLVAQNRRLQKDHKEAEADLTKYQGFAEKAVTSNSVDDARRSLELKAEVQKRFDNLTTEIARNEQLIKVLRDQLSKARAKVAGSKRNIVSLEARLEGSKIRKELAKASSDFNTGDSPLAALDDLEKAVNTEESEAEAWEELGIDDLSSQSLEEKYGSGSSADVEAELAKMMAGSKKG